MPRDPKPWFRKGRGWFVQHNGKQINLGRDKKAAHQKFHELMAEAAKHPRISVETESSLVCEILDAYLEWLSARVKEGSKAQRTYDWYRKYLQSFLKSIPNDLLVTQLAPAHVYKWVDSQAGWKTGKRGAMIAVQRAFNWAAKNDLLKDVGGVSPLRHLEKPAAGRREQIVTPDQYKQILSLTHDEEFRCLIELAWETGARPAELFTVEAAFVDVKNGTWVFPIQLSKGHKVQRVIYLTDRALEISKTLMAKNPNGPMLRNTDGNPWDKDMVNSRFHRLKQKMGIRLSLYAFRHSFVTHALLNGTDAVTTAVLAGHRDTSMISRHYAHLTNQPEHLRNAVNRAKDV